MPSYYHFKGGVVDICQQRLNLFQASSISFSFEAQCRNVSLLNNNNQLAKTAQYEAVSEVLANFIILLQCHETRKVIHLMSEKSNSSSVA